VVSELPKEKGNEENADLPRLHQKASGGIRQIGIANSERNVGRVGASPRRLSGVVGDGGARSGRDKETSVYLSTCEENTSSGFCKLITF